MNKAMSFLKNTLSRVLVVFLAGVLLVFSTACSGPASAGVAGTDRPGVSGEGNINGSAQQHELYDPIQERKGGMNEYSNVDPRTDTRGADAKAKQLIETTERNMIDQTDDVSTNTRRILDKKGENARDFGDTVRESGQKARQQARETIDTATDATDRARQDLSKNTQRAVDKAQDAVR